jgi:cell division protein FtsL
MSRSAAATTAPARDPRIRRSAAPRRISGPTHPSANPRRVDPRPRLLPSPRPLRAISNSGAAIASGATHLAVNVSGSRAMDRLVRSRAWIVIVGFGLIGIVTMQVSLLKLNAGIGRAMNTSAALQQSNASLRTDVSKLSATDRIQNLAAERGFAMPAPDEVGYLQAGDLARDGRRAARTMRAPDPSAADAAPTTALPAAPAEDSAVVAAGPGAAPNTDATTAAPAGTQTGTTPATTGGAGATPGATAAQAPPVSGGATPAGPTTAGGIAPPTTQTPTPGQ